MAGPSDMPEATPANKAPQANTQPTPAQPQQNGSSSQPPAATEQGQRSEKSKGKRKEKSQEQAAEGAQTGEVKGETKISGAEMKKRAKEEKAARRAAEKAAKDVGGGPGVPSPLAGKGASAQQQKDGQKSQQQPKAGPSASAGAGAGAGASTPTGGHRRAPSQATPTQQGQLPIRARTNAVPGPSILKETRRADKEVALFTHLYSQPKRQNLDGVNKEVHPAVLALGFQMSSYVVCGSNARCVGMLLAFKKAIQAYHTPQGTSLARHLTSHHLSPQIDYLKSHRPISVSMGNAIRWLKDFIIHIDPDMPEPVAKEEICAAIDVFIRERITVADLAIASTACAKIRNGNTIVTYGKSSIVEKTLLRAHANGTKFKVVVVDSRPLFEGKNLAKSLADAGIPTSYMMHSAASHALKDADLVLLGAHAMMSNGRLYSRVGTAAVAMLAHSRDVPVIVTCESLKFTDRVALDSIVLNEIAPPDELVIGGEHRNVFEGVAAQPQPEAARARTLAKKDEEVETKDAKTGLQGWRDVQGLQLLNILYDVTPAEYISMIISEYGSLPPSSVPAVHRIASERDVRF